MSRQVGVLPVEVSSFVNRRRERAELKRLLAASRLVTLTGVGGVGKTRVALRVVTEVRRGFADGVWWVELSALPDPELFTHVVAEVLGVQDTTLRPMEQVLAEFLASRRLLLVLDTCEHLVPPCAQLVDQLLRAAPGLRVLATSRQPLGIDGEQLFAVPPLGIRRQDRSGVADGVELFVERAQAASGAFTLTERNREVVARLCHRLDGIPLAIELAAVRLRALSVYEVLDRVDDRFQLLAQSAPAGVARHETLQAAIGWSHELCTPAEQLLWARVSVFAGTVDLTAISEVCADGRLPAEDVLEVVAGLVDKSILLREEHPGGVRYRLLDTIRVYGQDQLEQAGEQQVLRRRHRDYYLRLAQRFETEWCGPHQVAWRERLNREHDNLRAALDFCLSNPAEHQAGLKLVGALREFWLGCGVIREGLHYLDRVLALAPAPSPALTTALWACAWLALAQGDFAAVESRLAQCRPHVQPGDTATAGWITYITGVAAMFRGDQSQATALCEQAVDLYRHSGDRSTGLPSALSSQALSLALAGEFDRAVAVAEQGRAASERYGEQWMRSYADYIRAVAELGRGNADMAVTYARAALRFKRQLNDSLGIAMALDLLASAAAAQGHTDRPARLLGIAHQVWNTISSPQYGAPDLIATRQRSEQQARAALGDIAYQAAFDSGQDLDLDTALAYALDEQPPQPAEASPQPAGWAPLTRRERQVAELVAEGLTNQQIAARLVISKRTADAHIGHILTKLDLDTRTQIATWVTQRPAAGSR